MLELKELLRSIGQSTKGRKPELMQRSTDLLRHGSAKIQDKIHEIWEKSHAHKKPDNYHKMAQRYTPMKGAGHVPMQHKQFYRHDSHYKTHRGQYVIHPDVNFKENPFYVKIDTIIRPTALGMMELVHVHVCVHFNVENGAKGKKSISLVRERKEHV